jgi:hypothetical protein
MSIDHDKNFKELISTFFLEFLELFLPAVTSTIDPNSIVSLQQEYFADLVEGEEKIVDLLFSVKQSGTDTTFLIHIEAQADSQTNFNRRLFFYFARLHQKHLQPIYPIVIFSFDEPKRAEPETYSVITEGGDYGNFDELGRERRGKRATDDRPQNAPGKYFH